jgi:putative ABC transport system substrate-binding protein
VNKPFLGIPLTALLIALSGFAQAQQAVKVFRIGYLTTGNLSVNASRRKVFQQALRGLGYVEGKNVIIEVRSSEGSAARARALAAELVRRKVDIIVTAGSTATRFAKEATTTIPIVMTMDSDPVGNGFVANLARPGGNITGLSNVAPELSGKRLELLKEVVPNLSRVAVFGNAAVPGNAKMLNETEVAAKALGVKLQYVEMRVSMNIESAFRAAAKGRAGAILMLVRGPVALPHRREVAELAAKIRLPAMYSGREYVEAGGLMSYGVNFDDLDRRAAVYVDKILKGAKPSDLPVERPTKFELVINLKTAKALGLTIPKSILLRVDEVIE